MRILLASLLVLLPLSAQAVTIVVDPGPVGTAEFILDLGDFDEFNGSLVDGGTLSLDFVFPDMKHVEYEASSSPGRAQLTLHTSALGPPVDFSGTAFLADEHGTSVVDAFIVNRNYGIPPTMNWQANFRIFDGALAHGLHFDVTLPDWTTERISITGGSLRLIAGAGSEVVVGEWAPSGTVPEPSGLFLLGLAAVAWCSRGRGSDSV